MKEKLIRFFSPSENLEQQKSKATKEPLLTGYISASGKLVFPLKTVEQLPIDPQTTGFKVGTQAGKRKLKSLYLIPTQDEQEDRFALTKAAVSVTEMNFDAWRHEIDTLDSFCCEKAQISV